MEQNQNVVANADSPIKAIREFFGCTLQEMKALTPEDRAQLAGGIKDGTYTY